LIVDADMRNPRIHTFFGSNPNIGLTTALASIYGTSLKSGNLQNRRNFANGDDLSLADIIHIVRVRKKTGVLTVKSGVLLYNIKFQDGILVNADSFDNVDNSFLLQIIKESENLTDHHIEEIKRRSKETGKSEELVILNLGLIDKKKLEGFIRLKISKILKDILFLNEATFYFEKNGKSESDHISWPFISDGGFSSEFDFSDTPYISNIIRKNLTPTPFDNLYTLGCGPVPQNPSEILSSNSFQSLDKKLTNFFDLVIFDSPPVSVVTDPSLIASFVDGVILVVRARMAHRNVIRSTKEQLAKSKSNILGVVLNDMDMSSHKYYYSKYGYKDYSKYYDKNEDDYICNSKPMKRKEINIF
jgi:hypothetical protein